MRSEDHVETAAQRMAVISEFSKSQEKSTQFPLKRRKKVLVQQQQQQGSEQPASSTAPVHAIANDLMAVHAETKEMEPENVVLFGRSSNMLPTAPVPPSAPAPDVTMANMSLIMREIEHESLLDTLNTSRSKNTSSQCIPTDLSRSADDVTALESDRVVFKSNVTQTNDDLSIKTQPVKKTNPPAYPQTAFDTETNVQVPLKTKLSRSFSESAKQSQDPRNLVPRYVSHNIGYPNSSAIIESQLEQMRREKFHDPASSNVNTSQLSAIRKQAAKTSLEELKETKRSLYNLPNTSKCPADEKQEMFTMVRAKNVLSGKASNPTDAFVPNENQFRPFNWDDSLFQKKSFKVVTLSNRRSATSSVYTLNFADIDRIRLHDIPVLVKCFE